MKTAALLLIFSLFSNSAESLRELYSKPAEKNIEIVLGKGELSLIETVSAKEYFNFESQGPNNGATVVFSSAKGRYDYFDYMVILDTKREIINIRILKYRSEFGYEISNKGWLKQFYGKSSSGFEYGKNIDALSGATFSAPALVNDLNLILDHLSK
jgi:Na+-translocating ferredoxin:NAD+ oxidoreductase RnfG subunit